MRRVSMPWALPVLRRRKSTFIHGAEDDARDLMEHLAGYLGHTGP